MDAYKKHNIFIVKQLGPPSVVHVDVACIIIISINITHSHRRHHHHTNERRGRKTQLTQISGPVETSRFVVLVRGGGGLSGYGHVVVEYY